MFRLLGVSGGNLLLVALSLVACREQCEPEFREGGSQLVVSDWKEWVSEDEELLLECEAYCPSSHQLESCRFGYFSSYPDHPDLIGLGGFAGSGGEEAGVLTVWCYSNHNFCENE